MSDENGAQPHTTCYSHLSKDAGLGLLQFRIVALLPGEWSDPIQCQLTIHSLENHVQYKTVSYAWGDPNDTKHIDVNGVKLAIPSSLECCLRYLRNTTDTLTLWTDAICIDQTNLEERAVQVMNMGAIYWRCSSMFIWLGEPNPSFHSRNPFEMIMHWAEDKHFHQYPGFEWSTEAGEWVFKENPIYEEMFKIFADFISRPWWSRLWCVQEIALCPEADIILGNWRLPWATILTAKRNLYRHDVECCAGISSALPAKYTYFIDHILFLPQRFDLINIDEVIRSLRHKLCKDPRDKIYGLLGLLWKSPSAKLRPDYSLSVGEVFRQTTEAIISQSDGDLRFLTGSGLGSNCFQLPSWVRNFAALMHPIKASHEHSRFNRYTLYSSTADTKSATRILDSNILSVSGIFIDHIECIGPPMESRDWKHVLDNIQRWAEMAEILTTEYDCIPDSLQGRFWRTIMADGLPLANGGWTRIATPTDASISAWFARSQRHLELGREPPITAHVHAMWAATSDRAFFRTNSGHFGLCFTHSQPGDEVWVLAGGNVPFVLRKLDGAEPAEGNDIPKSFKLVGECYLHGFVDGEALNARGDAFVSLFLK